MLVLLFGCAIFFFLAGIIIAMGTAEDTDGATVAVAVCFCICLVCSIILTMHVSYKKGQINAINGVIQYELVEQHDGSVVWVKIEQDSRQ